MAELGGGLCGHWASCDLDAELVKAAQRGKAVAAQRTTPRILQTTQQQRATFQMLQQLNIRLDKRTDERDPTEKNIGETLDLFIGANL